MGKMVNKQLNAEYLMAKRILIFVKLCTYGSR
jgi:hypothetical protein